MAQAVRRPSWRTEWAIPSRRADQGRNCRAAEIRHFAENAPRWVDVNTSASLRWLLARAQRSALSTCASSACPAPETNPRDRPLGYMMPDFTIALAIGLVIGFILGYGVRAIISYRRHRHARRQSYRF